MKQKVIKINNADYLRLKRFIPKGKRESHSQYYHRIVNLIQLMKNNKSAESGE